MRLVLPVLVLALAAPAGAQTVPAPAPASSAAPAAASPCEPRQANLGGIGRAGVVGFTGAVFGDRVCATVANLALDAVAPQLAASPPADALVVAPLGNGAGATLLLAGGGLALVPAGAAPPGGDASAPVGPFVIAPGGLIPSFGGDTEALPRVVLAYAGTRLLLIGTSPVALADLARALRDQPDLFGADAVERAAVLASGASASLALRAGDGPLGTPGPAARYLVLAKRI